MFLDGTGLGLDFDAGVVMVAVDDDDDGAVLSAAGAWGTEEVFMATEGIFTWRGLTVVVPTGTACRFTTQCQYMKCCSNQMAVDLCLLTHADGLLVHMVVMVVCDVYWLDVMTKEL